MKDKNTDIRWIQRFNNYKKALASLQEAADLAAQRELSKLEKQGVIQAFEFTHELAWKTLKNFMYPICRIVSIFRCLRALKALSCVNISSVLVRFCIERTPVKMSSA